MPILSFLALKKVSLIFSNHMTGQARLARYGILWASRETQPISNIERPLLAAEAACRWFLSNFEIRGGYGQERSFNSQELKSYANTANNMSIIKTLVITWHSAFSSQSLMVSLKLFSSKS